ncbi:alpha-(1,3)-fucosyltransferase C-like [Rhipicephalus sanguineus]|uniref:alpha-(1,3)-fucosyltransferase C-like n=1 Tax=Rhipicephalus sanguineus TaxID=34632 RepID=UPI001895EF1E|nr:alpha-(1,3)-fucosyltransferase C-like [Rhipicephalus sanguineus]
MYHLRRKLQEIGDAINAWTQRHPILHITSVTALGIIWLVILLSSQLPKSHWLPWKEREECGQASRLRILLWSPSLHRHGAETLNNSESHIDSLDKGCHVTEDRGLVYHSDAIVFDANSFRSDDFPTYRHQGQAWVFWATDSPDGAASRYLPRTAPPFNWTMGFRQDADIVLPYRIWTRIAEPVTDTQHDLPSVYINKTKNAVWLISECEQDELEHPRGPENSRWRGTERFVKELLDEMYVDLIPKCGAEYCSSRDECLSIFQEAYFFIFVMESSPCFQHPAEMIYDALKYTIVPVYFGMASFGTSLPPHSFLDTTGMKDAKGIVSGLGKVRSLLKLYSAFFLRRSHYQVKVPSNNLDALCRALQIQLIKSSYTDIVSWWLGRATCPAFTQTYSPSTTETNDYTERSSSLRGL